MNRQASIMMSIRPTWCAAIADGRKHVEVRRTGPRRVVLPVRVLVYCTKETTPDEELRRTYGDHDVLNGKVIGEFVCDEIKQYWPETPDFAELARESLVPLSDLYVYIGPRSLLHGWHIKDFKLYDTPHPLSDYTVDGVTRIERAPQSWCYVRRKEDKNEDHD